VSRMLHSDATSVDTRAPEPHRIDNREESRHNVGGLAIDYKIGLILSVAS
jgi:hypothetical protein